LALGLAAWSWWAAWPVERAVWLFYTGDLPTARAQILAATSSVGSARWNWWQKFQGEVDAASLIAPDGGRWEELVQKLESAGYRRGVEVLLADGPARALPWFALANEDESGSPLVQCLERYCDAAYDQDAETMARLRAHIATLPLPPELVRLFRD